MTSIPLPAAYCLGGLLGLGALHADLWLLGAYVRAGNPHAPRALALYRRDRTAYNLLAVLVWPLVVVWFAKSLCKTVAVIRRR